MKKYLVRVTHRRGVKSLRIKSFVLYMTNKEKQVLHNTLELMNKSIFIPENEEIGYLEYTIKEVID